MTKVIGFYSNGHLNERGTSTALYDYAYYNKVLYNNISIIIYDKYHIYNDSLAIKKFEQEFKCYSYDDIKDINNIIKNANIEYLYSIIYGTITAPITDQCHILNHAVFNIQPHGYKYASVSKYLSKKNNSSVDYIPHMINLPICNENLRTILNIPKNAIVFGRYGGYNQFDITIAHKAIIEHVQKDNNSYFLFANTKVFYSHPRIIYLDKIIDLIGKVKFINTCDAMIHARSDGETFGLSIGEFSSKNKPVITSISSIDNAHIDVFGADGIYYNNVFGLLWIFNNIRDIIKSRDDWNFFKEYTPENVMDKFMKVFEL